MRFAPHIKPLFHFSTDTRLFVQCIDTWTTVLIYATQLLYVGLCLLADTFKIAHQAEGLPKIYYHENSSNTKRGWS